MLFEGAGLPSAVNPCSFLYPCQQHLLAAVLRQRIKFITANIRVKPYTDVLKFANVVYPENNSFMARNCFCCKRATPNVSTAHLQASLNRSVRHIHNTHQLIYARRILRVSS